MFDKNDHGDACTEYRFKILTVRLLDVPFHLDRDFDYKVEGLDITSGDFVVVPFGGGNRPQTGLVMSVRDAEGDISKLKPIHGTLDKAYSLNEEQLKLTEFLRDYTVCSTGEAAHTITPSAAFSKFEEYVVCNPDIVPTTPLSYAEKEMYDYVAEGRKILRNTAVSTFGSKGVRAIQSLIKSGYFKVELAVKEKANIRYTVIYELESDPGGNDDEFISAYKLKSDAHKKIMLFLREHGATEQSVITSSLDVTSAQIKNLVAKGYVKSETKESYRIPYSSKKTSAKPRLSAHQQDAANKIIALTRSGEPKAALLLGITGSGKTQVIRAIMDDVIASGRSVIVLVPEISLTPQTVSVFSACYHLNCTIQISF